MRIKICGITTREDARAALDAGADAIGMVLHPGSPRRVSFQQAREISDYVGTAADRFGVLVDAGPAELAELAASCRLTALQLHLRSCPRDLITQLPVPILPFLPGDRLALRRSAAWWPTLPVLVDSLTSEGAGGTGAPADLGVAAALARHRPVWIAGGLSPENVAQAVVAVRPEGVDASTSLEAAPGRKDRGLVLRFVAAAREASEAA
ncbi:MAG: phosphoribosylanthranilate isomerase [Candidatus Dormibacteria bacterium]